MATQEHAVLADADLAEGQLKAVAVGQTQVLLARDGGIVYATAATCPHYQLPLEKGMVCGGRLRCPWHESAFDLATGALREPPALDGLATYPVRVDGGQIYVTVDDGQPAHVPPPNRATASDDRSFVILGGGAAGTAAAEALREFGFAGAITILTADPKPPYDRPNLSKKYLAGQMPADGLPLRDDAHYANRGITIAHRPVTEIDVAEKSVVLADGGRLTYHKLLLATGGVPKPLDVPGGDRPNVLTLRTWRDADRILDVVAKGKRVVVVGASFIGMEVAACLIQRGASVTVVAPSAVPFGRLGPQVGATFLTTHEAKGVLFRMNAKVAAVDDSGVVLQGGEQIPADVVIVGVGVRPATDVLPKQWVGKDGSVTVDETLAVPGTGGTVYAAGDIAKYPDWMAGGEPTRIEHWRLAEQHGRRAAANMVGPARPFREVPFFWTNQYGKGMDYVGHSTEPDETVIDGDLASGTWMAYYLKSGRVAAAAGMHRKRDVMALMEVMRRVGRPSAEGVRAGSVDWTKELAKVGCGTLAAG
jgi:NADPH-dependent 2,4-dienoyl-CoA reductase/sulfur reductase-like enzyme/nitrite reductase/ring-hydroxylating ferredoxin subunit